MSSQPCKDNPDPWFSRPDSLEHGVAKRACLHCDLYWGCREWALNNGETDGIWGGLSGEDRAKIWKGWRTGRPQHLDKIMNSHLSALMRLRHNAESKHYRPSWGQSA